MFLPFSGVWSVSGSVFAAPARHVLSILLESRCFMVTVYLKGKHKKKRKPMSSPANPTKPSGQAVDPDNAAANKGSEPPKDSSLPPKIEPTPPTEKNANHCKPDGTPAWKITLEVGAILVGIYVAWVYHGQLQEMIESNKLTRESLESVQAAVVSFSAPQIKVTPFADKRFPYWMFVTPFTNGGNTATRTGQVYWNVFAPTERIPDDYAFRDQGSGNGGTFILGPKETSYTKPIAIPDDVVQDMLARRKRIYFYGWAAYRDRFKETPDRVTEFCYEFWNFIETGKNMESQVNVCQHHNCYDDECPDYKERIRAIR
jgi:hypothetical protein